jgi:DNA-binding CsgD family transcriptional regulator
MLLKILAYLVFIVSVALTAGSIILAARVRSRYKSDFHSALLYFLAFAYTFGFYGIWGQVLIESFLSPFIKPELIQRFTDFSLLIGLPFLVFGWLMLIRFACVISGRTFNTWKIIVFLFMNLGTLVFIGWILAGNYSVDTGMLISSYFILMNLIYSVSSAILIIKPSGSRSFLHSHDRKILGRGLIIISLLLVVPLLFYSRYTEAGLIFILMYFTGHAFIPFWLNYGTMATSSPEKTNKIVTLDDFCARYEISPRETDIVREICNGLSNKEISDKLFISLQTVKDHTHRIYVKTNVRSRVQLITLVKEEIKE